MLGGRRQHHTESWSHDEAENGGSQRRSGGEDRGWISKDLSWHASEFGLYLLGTFKLKCSSRVVFRFLFWRVAGTGVRGGPGEEDHRGVWPGSCHECWSLFTVCGQRQGPGVFISFTSCSESAEVF